MEHPRRLFLVWSLLAGGLPVALSAHGPSFEAGAPHALAPAPVLAGQRIFRQGLLPNGAPVTAIVQGDVAVEGSQFACVSCHRRSGWGAIEGDRIVLPTAGPALFQPRKDGYRQRPAYTNETLARALREGVDSAGRPLDLLMPRYRLDDGAMAALIAYLRTLSATPPPGLTETELHFATVTTSEVAPGLRAAMMDVLVQYFAEKNSLSRHEVRRSQNGPFFRDYKYKAYRKWVLTPWELRGPPETWREQLEDYNTKAPVFALVSGISTSAWGPIHDFCEEHGIPALLPNTDRPKISSTGFYTMYFSKGITLEAQAGAASIRPGGAHTDPPRVLQVYRGPLGERAARALSEYLKDDDVALSSWPLAAGEKIDWDLLVQKVSETGATALFLWLSARDLGGLESGQTPPFALPPTYLSSTLLDGDVAAIPGRLRRSARLIQPFTLPEVRRRRFARVSGWLRSRGIELRHPRVQAQTYFACLLAGEALEHIKRYFSRDYFLDATDHADRMAVYSSYYPDLSFGPGQRYLSKGAYLVELETLNEIHPATPRWVVP